MEIGAPIYIAMYVPDTDWVLSALSIVLRRLCPQQEKQPECEARWEVGRPKIKVANTAIQDDTQGSGLKVFSRNHRKLIDYLQQTFLPLCHLIFIQK